VLVTGGDTDGEKCTDILYQPGAEPILFTHSRDTGPTPRGTGCAQATSIACFLAMGHETQQAVAEAVSCVQVLIAGSVMVGEERLLFPSGVQGQT
jgi:hydroxymethylpyrimidine/phosphomethylpyrimidine kinase